MNFRFGAKIYKLVTYYNYITCITAPYIHNCDRPRESWDDLIEKYCYHSNVVICYHAVIHNYT